MGLKQLRLISLLAKSISINKTEKKKVAKLIPDLSEDQINSLIETLTNENLALAKLKELKEAFNSNMDAKTFTKELDLLKDYFIKL